MRLLIFSDLHASVNAAAKVVERAAGVDLLIGAGDFGNARRDLHRCIDVYRRLTRSQVLAAERTDWYAEPTSSGKGPS